MLGWSDDTPIRAITTPERAAYLVEKRGLRTIGELLQVYPANYSRVSQAAPDRSYDAHSVNNPDSISDVDGTSTSSQDPLFQYLVEPPRYVIGETYTCLAEIIRVTVRKNTSSRGPREILNVTFTDGRTTMTTALFGQRKLHEAVLKPGALMLLTGKLDMFNGQWQIKNPSYLTVREGIYLEKGKWLTSRWGAFGPLNTIVKVTGSQEEAQRLLNRPWLPIYPRRAGSTTAELMALIDRAQRYVAGGDGYPEMLPRTEKFEQILGKDMQGIPSWPTDRSGQPMLSFNQALYEIHHPPESGADRARQRIKFNEALQLQLLMALRRTDASTRRGFAMTGTLTSDDKTNDDKTNNGDAELVSELLASLPFELSSGQAAAWKQIRNRLASDRPASMMLQGDVGAGKTVVALMAMLTAIESGYQCAFIAPTEVLAAQHARTLVDMLGHMPRGAGIGVTLLTGSQKTQERKQAMLNIVSGQSGIIVGTHAVLQDTVEFFKLGLVVVDEQHRFGVRQRDKLRDDAPENATPHMLVMTATPIPRTVAMTMFGDLTSIRLPGLPQGRGKITTSIVQAERQLWVQRMWQRLREEIAAGRQGFIVAPKIDGDGGLRDLTESLTRGPLAGLRTGVVHGRMPAGEKDQVMMAFSRGEIDVLLATTVIEVGVDVPNASIMIVYGAERFGISQLHQLRGRIGRGAHDSVCLLHTEALEDTASWERLQAVAGSTDGFHLAELDLQQRTEGDILGESQSGAPARRTALLDLAEDGDIVAYARDYAEQLVAFDEDRARSLVADFDLEEQDFIEKG